MKKQRKHYVSMVILYMLIAVVAALRFQHWLLTGLFGFVAGVYVFFAIKTPN